MRTFIRWTLFGCLTLVVCLTQVRAQGIVVNKIEPPNWWIGMQTTHVQLMLTGEHLAGLSAQFHSPQIHVVKCYRTPNPGYAFLDIEIAPNALDGNYRMTLTRGNDTLSVTYPLLRRKSAHGRFQGFSSSDVVYLITPDRFAQGDTSGVSYDGMLEGLTPDSASGRHGGNIQGIIDHLEYLATLGITTVWVNPLIENNNPWQSYHGYGATDLYRIDARFGTNALYDQLVAEAHRRGLKVIMDHVNNHISSNHPWMKSLPMADWINGSQANHLRTMHYKTELLDTHADSALRETTTRGWFADHMPDLNQTNPFVAKYLIQNTLWWIESSGIDGIREDTYPYIDRRFAARWGSAILKEYPSFNIVGEVWIGQSTILAAYQTGSRVGDMDTHLPCVTDFALYDAIMKVFGGDGSMRGVYDVISRDFLFGDADNLLTFLDNHDVKRIAYVTGDNEKKTQLAWTLLLTLRGIPEMLYGDEIGMTGGKEHGVIRSDFPGGFPNATHNAFRESGRTPREQSMFAFMQKLLTLRKKHAALREGRLVHVPPVNECYTYCRILPGKSVAVVINTGDTQKVSLAWMKHLFPKAHALRGLLHGASVTLSEGWDVDMEESSGEIFEILE